MKKFQYFLTNNIKYQATNLIIYGILLSLHAPRGKLFK